MVELAKQKRGRKFQIEGGNFRVTDFDLRI
jgi:hypothetical protein